MKHEFPYKGQVFAANRGEASGNLNYAHAIDLSSEPGRVILSPASQTVLDTDDVATFDNPCGAFAVYGNRWWGLSDVVVRNASNQADDATDGWALDTSSGTPTNDNDWDEGDFIVFDGLLLASSFQSDGDIYGYDGSSWFSWWQGASYLNQTALATSGFKAMKVGPNGRLYILDGGNKVYNVTTAGTVTKSGNGTLDFSATTYKFVCMAVTSTRMFLGGADSTTGESVIVEWDMSLNESTPLRIHKPGGNGCASIVIWNDSPVAYISDGSLRFFDGSSFYEQEGARVQKLARGVNLDGDETAANTIITSTDYSVHPNGSAIIDGLPHFLIKGNNRYRPEVFTGVYCYDPKIGFYNRFPIARDGGVTDFQVGTVTNVGALAAAKSSKTKFIASLQLSVNGVSKSVIVCDNQSNTLPSIGRFVLNPFWGSAKDLWQKVEVLAKKLGNSSDRILLKYRLNKSSTITESRVDVTWSSTTVFTSVYANAANIAVGDWVLVSTGNGAGCSAHVSAISYNNPTYTVTLDEPITGVSNTNTGIVSVDNWRRLATISAQNTDYHDISIPTTEGSHTFWLMVELRSTAGSVVELDKIIVTSKDGK